MRKESKVAEDKARLRGRIIVLYPELVGKYRRELCMVCGIHAGGECHYGLVPVTGKGERCPYFETSAIAGMVFPRTPFPRKELQ